MTMSNGSIKNKCQIANVGQGHSTLELSRKEITNEFTFRSTFQLLLAKIEGPQVQNNRVKYLHERCFRMIYQDKICLYEKLLEKDGSFLDRIFSHTYDLGYDILEPSNVSVQLMFYEFETHSSNNMLFSREIRLSQIHITQDPLCRYRCILSNMPKIRCNSKVV